MLRDWIPRAVLALVALASFFGGSASGSVKSALVIALVVGTLSAILLDWLAQRRRENAVQE
ncbi:hypothetical protein JS562_50135, partial [Agrobacterium sp. S2]|nr:hypothetical protein [Agrobacterium sp. S2]